MTPERLDQLKQLTSEDEALQTLSRVIKDGWPDHKYNLPVMAKPFWDKRDEIHEAEACYLQARESSYQMKCVQTF